MTTLKMEVDNWKALPWKRFQKVVFRLQTRIYKARKNGDRKLVNKLQKLLLNSKAAKYLAVRQVTQLNQGKATAGVDGKTARSLQRTDTTNPRPANRMEEMGTPQTTESKHPKKGWHSKKARHPHHW